MGTVYLRQQYERIILRHYDEDVSDVLNAWIRARLQSEGLLNDDDEYTPDGSEATRSLEDDAP